MATAKTKKRNLPLIALILSLSALMMYYFLIYVPENKKDLLAQGIRRIGTIANNIQLKHRHYQEAIDVSPREYFLKWFMVKYPTAEKVYVKFGENRVEYSFHLQSGFQEIHRNKGKDLQMDPWLKPENVSGQTKNPELWESQTGKYHFVYSFGTYKALLVGRDRKPVEGLQPQFWGYVPGFMNDLQDDEFFEDVFLVQTAADIEKKIKPNDILNNSKLKIRQYQVRDTVIHKGPTVYHDMLAGEMYYVFHQRVKVSRNLEFSVVALVSEAKLTTEARAVPAWFLTFCVIGLLLLLLLWPLLKIFLLNKKEKLNSIDVHLAVAAFVFAVAVVVLLTGGLFSFSGAQQEKMDETLQKLSAKIQARFNLDVAQRVNILNDPVTWRIRNTSTNVQRIDLYETNNGLRSKLRFNEIFNVEIGNERYGRVNQLIIERDRAYPDFFNTGISVANRPYFTQVARALKNNLPIKPYAESIKSRSSGDIECAISIPYTADGEKEVRVITSPMPSVINPVLPTHYSFAVIDEKGLVQFHSDESKIENENFFDQCRDKVLKGSVEHGTPGLLDITYNQIDYRAHVTRLYSNLHLITLYNLDQTRSVMSDVFTLSLVTLIFLILYLCFLHLIFSLDVQKFQFIKTSTFFYRWLNPLQISGTTLNKLILFNLMLAFFQLTWFFFFTSVVASIIFIMLTVTMSCFINYSILTDEGEDENHKSRFRSLAWFKTISLLLMCVFSYLLVSILWRESWLALILLIFIWIFTLTAWYHKSLLRQISSLFRSTEDEKANTDGEPAQAESQTSAPSRLLVNITHRLILNGDIIYPTYTKYRLFLLAWIIVIAICPSVIIFKDHFYFENIARIKHDLSQHVKSLQLSVPMPSRGFDYANALQPPSPSKTLVPYHEEINGTFYSLMPLKGHGQSLVLRGRSEIREHKKKSNLPPFDFSYAANRDQIQISAPGASEQIESSNTQEIERAQMLPPMFSGASSKPITIIFLVLLTLSIILWISCYRIPARIFFMPLYYIAPPARLKQQPKTKVETADTGAGLIQSEYSFVNTIRDPNLANAFLERSLLQEEAHKHAEYKAKWEAFAEDEKHVLLDLADDGIANLANKDTLDILEQKGMIITYPYIEIKELPFANFVLKAVTDEEREVMIESAKQQSGWHNWRLPLIILVISLLGFLSLIEQGLVARISAVLASVALLLPNIINIGSSVGRLFGQKQAGV